MSTRPERSRCKTMDFVADRLADSRQLRLLNVSDDFNR